MESLCIETFHFLCQIFSKSVDSENNTKIALIFEQQRKILRKHLLLGGYQNKNCFWYEIFTTAIRVNRLFVYCFCDVWGIANNRITTQLELEGWVKPGIKHRHSLHRQRFHIPFKENFSLFWFSWNSKNLEETLTLHHTTSRVAGLWIKYLEVWTRAIRRIVAFGKRSLLFRKTGYILFLQCLSHCVQKGVL